MKWKSVAFIVCICAACCLAATLAQGHWFFYENLSTNPGAEDGAASPDGKTVVPIPGWTTTGGATVVAYGTPGDFPSYFNPIPIDPGVKFFAGGPDATASSIFQAVDVPSELWPLIDSNLGMSFTLAGCLGGYGAEADYAAIELTLKNASGDAVAKATLDPVTAADRGGGTALLPRLEWGFVPQGTRRIEVIVTFTHVDGSYNNAFVDNVEVRFHPLDKGPGSSWGALKALFGN